MSIKWLSINDIKRLAKQKLYQLETGSTSTDRLVYDRQNRKYVGHIENYNSSSNSKFTQDRSYKPSFEVISYLNSLDQDDWNNDSSGW
ncbi:MAG: hypothetical protein COZ18_11155 [Flexibacter sp. CG_4_10_14_3_um_filter_32_15]|nr:MAG: hypothetical protein COZ18_11155 [Flexibacter sp. CG_4_10_14_3_um_filter_32_15]